MGTPKTRWSEKELVGILQETIGKSLRLRAELIRKCYRDGIEPSEADLDIHERLIQNIIFNDLGIGIMQSSKNREFIMSVVESNKEAGK